MVDNNRMVSIPFDDIETETEKGYFFLINNHIEHVSKKVATYDSDTNTLSVARWVVQKNLETWGLNFIKIYEVAKR